MSFFWTQEEYNTSSYLEESDGHFRRNMALNQQFFVSLSKKMFSQNIMWTTCTENYSETSSEPLFKLNEIKKEVIKKERVETQQC